MAFTTFKAKYVFSLFPYWRVEPKDTMSHFVEDYTGIGYTISEQLEDYPKYETSHTYAANGLQEISDITDFFDARLGRQGSFWFPSFRKDVVLTNNIGSSDTDISIEDIEYSTFYPATPGTGRYIFIYVNQSKWFARKITAAPSSTVLTMESSLGELVLLSQIKMVSFLYLGRFNIDEIDWEFHTPTIATVELLFIELPKEYTLL